MDMLDSPYEYALSAMVLPSLHVTAVQLSNELHCFHGSGLDTAVVTVLVMVPSWYI